MWINTSLYKNYDRVFPVGYMGGGIYHTTVGKPDYALDAGTYRLKITDHTCGSYCNPLDYSLITYQRGSGSVSLKF